MGLRLTTTAGGVGARLLGAFVGLVSVAGCSNHPSTSTPNATLYTPLASPSEYREAEYDRLDAIELSIVRCMAAAGFDYRPYDPRVVVIINDVRTIEDPVAYAATHGYGVSVGDPLDTEPQADPNDAILRSLSNSEQLAWHATLEGDGQRQGCRDAAGAESPVDLTSAAIQAHFADELEALANEVFADPRSVDGQQAWVDCMAAAGYDYANPGEPAEDFRRRLAAVGDGPEVELDQLRADELATAGVDASCPFNNFGGWQQVYDSLYREYEAAFATEHEAEILAIVQQQG